MGEHSITAARKVVLYRGYSTTLRAAVTRTKRQTHCLSWHHHNGSAPSVSDLF